jgi:hypothetical protein
MVGCWRFPNAQVIAGAMILEVVMGTAAGSAPAPALRADTLTQISDDVTSVDGWRDFRFGMTPGQTNKIIQRDGNRFMIGGLEWHVVLEFANAKLDAQGDPVSGELNRITLYHDKPYWAAAFCDYRTINAILNDLQNNYGQFVVQPMPRQVNGAVPDFAVKNVGQVEIKFNYIPGGIASSTCSNPRISYYKAGMERPATGITIPNGRY